MTQTPEDPRLPDPGDRGEPAAATGPDLVTPAAPPPDQPAPPDGGPPTLAPLDPLPPIEDDGAGPRRPWRSARVLAAGVAVLVLAGGLAVTLGGGDDDSPDGVATVEGSDGADGNDGSSGNSSSERPSDSEMQDAMLEYAQCMREHGVDMPDPEFSEDGGGVIMRQEAGSSGGPGGATGGPGDATWEAAQEACASIMEDARGSVTPPSPEEIAEMQDQLVAMAECMRARGYDMPDPTVGGDGRVNIEMRGAPGEGGPSGAGDDQFQEDQQACNEQAGLENGPMRGGGGSTSGAAEEAD